MCPEWVGSKVKEERKKRDNNEVDYYTEIEKKMSLYVWMQCSEGKVKLGAFAIVARGGGANLRPVEPFS